MTKSQSMANAVCMHVSRVIGNNHRLAPGVIREIQGWVYNSGPEWTVSRLKMLKQSTVQYLAIERSKPMRERRFPCPVWVKRDYLGFPKGHLGALIRTLCNGSERDIGILLSVLNTYTALISTQVTDKQKEKFLEAINGPVPSGFHLNASDTVRSLIQLNQREVDNWRRMFKGRYTERFSFAGLNSAKPSMSSWPGRRNWHPWVLSFIESTMTTGPWTPILSSMGVPVIDEAPPQNCMGRIHVIQERGFKARVVAMPIAGLQVAFEPLHRALSSILQSLTEDCTFDQQSGVHWVQQELRSGKTVHAVDLSSATDNFPLDFQVGLLIALGYPRWREFSQVCRSQWQSDFGKLTYTKGQPMGLYGSFPLFALSHHALLRGLAKRLGVGNHYRILGDDVVISDDTLAQAYMETMKNLNVPISWDKTLASDILSEFAGSVIAPTGVIPTAKSPKAFGLLGVHSFINYVRVTGQLGYALTAVPARYRWVAKALAALPPFLGGAGVNPEGLSMQDRLTNFANATSLALPKAVSLRSTLWKFRLGGNPWVNKVTIFLNDQLEKIDQEIDRRLSSLFDRQIIDSTEGRGLLMQVSEGDLGFPLTGTISVGRPSKGLAANGPWNEWRNLIVPDGENKSVKVLFSEESLKQNLPESVISEDGKVYLSEKYQAKPKESTDTDGSRRFLSEGLTTSHAEQEPDASAFRPDIR